ncbi:ERAD-associated E3 ubiquitin-protein ligase HRD1B [Cucumispora dikerogammari]|nr:ERAD-associated E3 ubiquitin-protein ligase HRD1B [Cucumispora dikerogammari]
MIDKLFIPFCLIASLIAIPSDLLFFILKSLEERTDLKLLHILFICYTIHSVYSTLEQIYINQYTETEYTSIEEHFSDAIINTLFICMMFGNTINIFYVPLLLLLLLIKINTKILLERIKAEYNNAHKKMMYLNLLILCSILYYFYTYFKIGNNIVCYVIYDCLIILTNYITISYYLFIIKDKEESEYKNIYFHLQNLFVIFLTLIFKLCFLIITSYLKRVPFNIFRSFWAELYNFKSKLKGLFGYLKIEKLLSNSETVNDVECPICTERISIGKKLKCGHAFHVSCLKLWVLQQQVCPVCREALFTDRSGGGGRNSVIGFFEGAYGGEEREEEHEDSGSGDDEGGSRESNSSEESRDEGDSDDNEEGESLFSVVLNGSF